MLIRFIVENFKSFKEETEFNLLTGSVRKHSNHVHHTKQGIDVLPTAVVYGGNASGKSNLIQAIFAARQLIITGTNSKTGVFNLVEKFAFSKESFYEPTKFEFEFKTNKDIYSYGLVVNKTEIKEEWLYSISAKKEDTLLFERKGRDIVFATKFIKKKADKLFLENEVRGLRINQPFLTESKLREILFFDDAYKWFKDLLILFPEGKFSSLNTYYHTELLNFSNFLLGVADTNVTAETEIFDFDTLKDQYPSIREFVENNYGSIMKDGASIKFPNGIIFNIYYNQESKKLEAMKLKMAHKKSDSKTVFFERHQESDGTQQLLNLASCIFPAIYENRVVIIDEIDRSIHPLLSKKLIEIFLQKRIENKGTGQLICTTHEDLIIDMDLLRPDEVWFVQKNDEGASEIYPLSDFKIRYDIDVRKGYLNGRFGAIPDLKIA